MPNRRQVLVGSVLFAGSVAFPEHLKAACDSARERWPQPGELVEGNSRKLLLDTARAMMEKLGNAALVTIDDGQLPRVRSMGTSAPETDFRVWMTTGAVSRKIGQIRLRPEVALHYVDAENLSEVTLMGIAEVHDDPKTMRQKNFYSEEQMPQWWPGFPTGYAMISVRPLWLEISAPGTEIKGDRKRWRPAGLSLSAA